MIKKWLNTKRVKLATPGRYRRRWHEFKTEYGRATIEEKEQDGRIYYDVCLSIGNSWGWVYEIATLAEAEEIIAKKQVQYINTF